MAEVHPGSYGNIPSKWTKRIKCLSRHPAPSRKRGPAACERSELLRG